MYKNKLIITFGSKEETDKLLFNITWDTRESFYRLLLDYVPRFIREIVPNEQGYDITWIDESYFQTFINDYRYVNSKEFLNRFDINLTWI